MMSEAEGALLCYVTGGSVVPGASKGKIDTTRDFLLKRKLPHIHM